MAALSAGAIVALVASSVAAAGGLAATGYQLSQGTPGAPKTPTGTDPSQILKSMLPGAKADAAARAGGGISPEFLAGLTGQESCIPGGGLSILGDIRSQIGQGP